jgi:hypothetical protein
MKPYVLTSPPWETTSGGVRVMYGLYGWLLAKGQVAFLNEKPISGGSIAIYPEIQQGNPAESRTIVRYILNKPGVVPALLSDGSLKHGPTEFDPDDILIYFSKLYAPSDDSPVMFLPICNLHLFKDQKKQRTKQAVLIGKGMNYPLNYIHRPDAFVIDRQFAQDQVALADLLNECEALYCYDPNSAMTEIARLCGTRVVMINSLYSKEEFSKYEPGMNGISWGTDEGIKLDTQAFRDHYHFMVSEFEQKLDEFIDQTQE